MNKKLLVAAAAAAMLLAGCSSSTPAQKEEKKEEKAVEKQEKEVAKEEKKEDVKEDVIDGILSDLQKDGYEIDRERTEDGISNAKIYSADKGETEYEFFIFEDDEAAKAGMQTLYDDALRDKDASTQLAFTDDKTQIEETDSEDHENTLYVLNNNTIVKGTVPSSEFSQMKEQFITWGFLYGEQVTNEDIAETEKND